jgi:predicted ATPase
VRAPILVVATTRSEPMGAFPVFRELIGTLLQDGLADRMELSPLSRDEVALLARRTLGPEPVDRELTDWLFDQTRGNPLLAGSLLEELAADPARRVVPASVRERVRRMGAGLPDDEREVLDLAAVLGRSFELRTVARLLPDGAKRWTG